MGWRPTVEKRACARSYPLTVHVPDRIASTLAVRASNLCVRVGMKMRGFGETHTPPVPRCARARVSVTLAVLGLDGHVLGGMVVESDAETSCQPFLTARVDDIVRDTRDQAPRRRSWTPQAAEARRCGYR